LYKNSTFLSIPTLSCVLASTANNKGMLNTPAFQSLFPFLRSLPLSLSLAPSLRELPCLLASDLLCPALLSVFVLKVIALKGHRVWT
jgi:hypothetical protein